MWLTSAVTQMVHRYLRCLSEVYKPEYQMSQKTIVITSFKKKPTKQEENKLTCHVSIKKKKIWLEKNIWRFWS